ncbi:MAG: endonuclease domain-containing protein [Bacteroidetes bacterium]|nr:endonuclease domain-containing protein [Bacteroidota bacterium]MBU1719245.1 endonuclease domain-containing protein [Bacteroidota bacterium]
MPTQLYNMSHLAETRKVLRKNMTPAELVLWEMLKEKKLLGRKFRRQFSIGNYIADFYCTTEKLIIELDGQQHFTKEGVEKDKERDKFLAELGMKVLRFENKEVLDNLTEVLKKIKLEIAGQSASQIEKSFYPNPL